MKHSVIALLISFFLVACKGDRGPVGPAANMSGNIAGTIRLLGFSGNFLTSADSVQISIEPAMLSTMSLSDGSWEITGVPAGIYDITFSKAGFFTYKTYNLQFVGGGTYYFNGVYGLSQIPSAYVVGLSVVANVSGAGVHFVGTISSPDTVYRDVYVLLSKTPLNVRVPFEFLDADQDVVYPDSLNFTVGFYNSSIYAKGTTLYAVAFNYGNESYGYGLNYNPATQMEEFDTPGVKFSNMVSFVVP